AEDGIVVAGNRLERGARKIACARALDLDHIGAVVGQHLRADRTEHHLREVDHAHAGERQFMRTSVIHAISSSGLSVRAIAGTSGFGPGMSPGSAPCARSFFCSSFTSTSRTRMPL